MSDHKNINIGSNNNTNVIETRIIYTKGGGETEQKFTCEKCKKNFSSQQTLKTHTLTTNCVKDYSVIINNKCDYCSKDFSSKQMLTYHQNNCVDKKLHHLTNHLTSSYEAKIKLLEDQILSLSIKNTKTS